MRNLSIPFILICNLFCLNPSFADTLASNTPYEVCFTPGQNCTQLIVDAIDNAKQSIFVQAYSFTSKPIAEALVKAKRRNVNIKVILDKSQNRDKGYSSAKFFSHYGIPVWIDTRVAIAHNKVMVFDDSIVELGSFNFTRAAQERNAENVLIIHSKQLAEHYMQNWYNRERLSMRLADNEGLAENKTYHPSSHRQSHQTSYLRSMERILAKSF